MADGFLESHHEDYERRKQAWLRKKKHLAAAKPRQIEPPDDEAL